MKLKKIVYFFAKYFIYFLVVLILVLTLFEKNFPLEVNVNQILQGGSIQHPFGTDALGRDLLLKVFFGARTSVLVGILCGLISLFIGVIVGGISSYIGGWFDQIVMRIVEILMALPQAITIGLFVFYFKSSNTVNFQSLNLIVLIFAISLGSWMGFAKLTRNLTLREKNQLYVESAVSLGASHGRILFKHILPNIGPSLILMLGLQIPNFLMFESFLTFLGVGVHPPMSSWGSLMLEGWKTLSVYPYLLIFPSLILFLTVFSLNILFDENRLKKTNQLDSLDSH